MPKGTKAGELVKRAAGAKGAELAKNGVKKVAEHKAVQKGLDKTTERAVGAALSFATGGAATAVKRRLGKRKERRDAEDLARQVGGTYSLNVIIGSERYQVVWLDDNTPYRAIPELPKEAGPLEEVRDLKHFQGIRHPPMPQE